MKHLIYAFIGIYSLCSAQDFSWYQPFYEKLRDDDISSIRYFQIWVAPGGNSASQKLWVGGNQQNFDIWLQSTEEFLESALFFKKLWPGRLVYELTVDSAVYESHCAIFQSLTTRYPDHFHLTLIEDYAPETDSPMRIGYEQCSLGVASVCSDYWRIKHFYNPHFTINIYADIDTLSQALCYKKQDSARGLGLELPKDGIYFPFFNNSKLGFNIDFIAFKRVSPGEEHLIQACLEERLLAYQPVFRALLQQHEILFLESYHQYKNFLQQRIIMLKASQHIELNRYHLISSLISTNFWLNLAQKGHAYPYFDSMADTVENFSSWVSPGITPCYESVDGELLRTFYTDAEQERLITLFLMLYDKDFLRKHPTTWSQEFEEDFQKYIQLSQELIGSLSLQCNLLKINTSNDRAC